MDGFWSSWCLNNRINLPDKIGSFLSGTITPMRVKNRTLKIVFFIQNMHNGNCFSTLFLNIYAIFLKNIILGTPGNVFCAISCQGVIHFMGQILISKLLIYVVGTLSENWHFSDANYSIRQNTTLRHPRVRYVSEGSES